MSSSSSEDPSLEGAPARSEATREPTSARGPEEAPEAARIDALLAAARRGTAGEAEREELALYLAERPELAARVEENARVAGLGVGWLERVERDERLQALEHSRRTRVERGVGLAAVLGGWLLHFPLPLLGYALSAFGVLVLLASIVRLRRATRDRDPYEDVTR